LDESFGFAVGAGPIRLGEHVAESEAATRVTNDDRSVVRPVVAHDPLHVHTVVGEPPQRTFEELHGGRSGFVVEDLDVRETSAVVHGDMDELPAGATVALLTISGDTVSRTIEPPQFLDVEVTSSPG
jgi:hypothetical protein